MDTLNTPIRNWAEQREEWMKILRREDCYNSLQLADKNIIAVAAHVNNLVREYGTLDKESDEYWDLQSIAFKFRIQNVEEKHRELLLEDLSQDYKNNKEDIITKFNVIKDREESVLKASSEDIEEIRKRREESFKLLEESKAEEKEIQQVLKQIQMATSKRADELFKTINGLWRG